MSEGKTIASFRIEKEVWNRFGDLAKSERLTATDLLTDYIDRCLEASESMYGIRHNDMSIPIADGNEIRLEIETMKLQIESLRTEVEIIKKPSLTAV